MASGSTDTVVPAVGAMDQGKVEDVDETVRSALGHEATGTSSAEQRFTAVNRRGFLMKGAIVGAVAIGENLFTGAGTALGAPKRSTYGYRIGDSAADFGGYDQYMKPRKLSDNLGSWVLIDLCPVWCGPCNASASNHFAFVNYVRSQGVPFHMQPVVVENSLAGPSSRTDAERWAVTYGLEREALMHANGDANSPLRQLVVKYAQANNNASPAYPTYVLVDPSGVIRDYILGADLNVVQASLANKTGKTLDRSWNVGGTPTAYTAVADPNVGSASFALWDGTAVSMLGPSGHIENQYGIFDTSEGGVSIDLSKLGDPITESGGGLVRDRAKEFDLYSPITMTFKAGVSPEPGSYRRITTGQTFFIEASSQYPEYGSMLKGTGLARTKYHSDGTIEMTITASDFVSSWVGPDDDGNASNVISTEYSVGDPILPYQTALSAADDVNADASLSSTTKATLTSLLAGGRAKLGNRDYAGSAQQFAKAATILEGETWVADRAAHLRDHVAWLGTHYSD